MVEASRSELSRKYFISTWVIVCSVSYGIGTLLGEPAGDKIGFLVGSRIALGAPVTVQWIIIAAVAGLLSGTVFSAITSISQWLVLRKSLRRAALWIPLSMTGTILGSIFGSIAITALVFSLSHIRNSSYFLIFGSFILSPVSGLIGGYFEWLLLRQQSSQAKKWIQARVIGTGISTLVATLLVLVRPIISPGLLLLVINGSGFICGIAFGMFTGFRLAFILSARTDASPNINGS